VFFFTELIFFFYFENQHEKHDIYDIVMFRTTQRKKKIDFLEIGWDWVDMTTNGNNLSITILNNELPYIPTELWDKINVYVYLMEIRDNMKTKEETWRHTNSFINELKRMGHWETDEECNSLYYYLGSFGHFFYNEELPMKLYKDYFTIYDEFGWDFGGDIRSYKDLMEIRESEGLTRASSNKGSKALSILRPIDMDITIEVLEGEEVVY